VPDRARAAAAAHGVAVGGAGVGAEAEGAQVALALPDDLFVRYSRAVATFLEHNLNEPTHNPGLLGSIKPTWLRPLSFAMGFHRHS